jgi:hypothetical protein
MKTGCKGPTDCLYPYPKNDPTKYIECVPNPDGTGTPFVEYCTGGKLYNRRDKKCDTPYNCGCNYTVTTQPPPATTTTTTTTTTSDPDGPCQITPDEKKLDCKPYCNSKCPHLRYNRPYPLDSHKYVVCNGNKGHVECCSESTIFYYDKLTCGFPCCYAADKMPV